MLGILDGTGYEKGGAGSASRDSLPGRSDAPRLRRPQRVRRRSGLREGADRRRCSIRRTSRSCGRRSIRERATPSDQVRPGKPTGTEQMETTHYSVVDAEGNAVAVTYTLNGGYGNGITVPGLGFLLNNEMDDFASKPGTPNMFGLVQGEANAIQPGKRPLSSMTPTIVLKDGKLFMTAGAPGGSRISTAVAAGDPERHRFRDERPGCGRRPARSPSVAAGQAVARARHLAGHGGAAQEPRLRGGLRAGRRARTGRGDRQRRRMAAGRDRTADRRWERRLDTERATCSPRPSST